MARDPFAPVPGAPRHPTDTAQMHGQVLNAPRMMQIGGADKLKREGSPHRNKLNLKKPGKSY